jgi:hypothetical protein
MIRTYSDLRKLQTLEDRYKYLALRGQVGETTFGFDRYMNQEFYRSREWKNIRNEIILRDNGCDLGVEGHDIHRGLYIHHMNPMTVSDLRSSDPSILDPEFLITVRLMTHNAIHYGDERLLPRPPVERRPGDTKLW